MYPELQRAYDFFNDRLFAGMLPPCLITLNRSKDTLGYFSPRRFVRRDGQVTHEIAMNPAYFAVRPIKDTLSTLVHEQVHLWQAAFGTPSRPGYHNREWSNMMEAVGLMPSTTGAPGGARVGDQMDHYVMPDRMFDRATTALLTEHYTLSWMDRFPVAIPRGAVMPPEPYPLPDAAAGTPSATDALAPEPATESTGEQEGDDDDVLGTSPPPAPLSRLPELPPGIDLGAALPELVWPSDQRRGPIKSKYRCHGCGNQVWGKQGMDLHCNPCDRNLEEIRG